MTLIIRGGAPNENRFYLDDVEVPNINHFATQGASGGRWYHQRQLHPGGGLLQRRFSRQPGQRPELVLNFRQRDGRDDRLGGNFMLSATDISTDGGSSRLEKGYLFSARRSTCSFCSKRWGCPSCRPTTTSRRRSNTGSTKKRADVYRVGAIDQFELNLETNDDESSSSCSTSLPVSPQWNYTNGLTL